MCIRNGNPPYTDVRRHGRNELSKRKWQNHDEEVPSLIMSLFCSSDARQKWSQKHGSCQQLHHCHCHWVRKIWKHHFSNNIVTGATQVPHQTDECDLQEFYISGSIHLEAQTITVKNRKKREIWCWFYEIIVCNLSGIPFFCLCNKLFSFPKLPPSNRCCRSFQYTLPPVCTSGYQMQMCIFF